ncbi:uncharacterized protein LOC128735965 [Sabethes cyaneus]|uniref:uncharacterized protein LOC128735965 n=1 Tax=Sabethes cyaneus TaxID=53552 RepID=UPI00237D5230|nr:uncharacterized protein LOC128735965 [Sabethes cyaneus]
MEDIKDLKKNERQLRSSIKTIAKFVQGFRKEVHEKQIDVRLETLENAMRKFYTVRRKIEMAIDDEDEKPDTKESAEQRAERLEALAAQREEEYDEAIRVVEEEYYEIKTSLLALRSSADTNTVRATNDVTSAAAQPCFSKVKLPDIKLPTFSGKSPVMLFKRLIQLHFRRITTKWLMWEKRFENKKLIVKAHLDALFAIEPMRKESYDALCFLINEFDRNLQMLAKIGEDFSNWSTILAHMVYTRLDSTTLRHWESHHNSKEAPKYEILIEFLRDQCTVLQSIAPSKSSTDESRRPRLSVTHTAVQSSRRCLFCGDSFHLVFQCNKFKSMLLNQRMEEVNKKRLCRNCLSAGHFAENCSRGSCIRCGRNHHTLLHHENGVSVSSATKPFVPKAQGRPQTAGPQPQQPQHKPHGQTQTTLTQTPTEQKATTSYPAVSTTPLNTHPGNTTEHHTTITLEAVAQVPSCQVLISTAIVRVEDQFGNISFARTLLDSCSELCYMTSKFSKRLKLRESPAFLQVQGIGNGSTSATKCVEANIQPRHPSISSFAETQLRSILITFPKKWYWRIGKPGPVDMIIGAEIYFDLLSAGKTRLSKDGPTLQETVFGWVISGRVPKQVSPRTSTFVSSTVDLQELIAKFWELETCYVTSTLSLEETACEELFERTTVRDAEGRFVVSLPKKENVIQKLGESKAIALKRFSSLEKRLDANPELKAMYKEFIHEYQLMGHMKEARDDPYQEPIYYMPHHAVLKPDSTTTKLRVVFDGSCRTSTGVSLNVMVNALMR